MLIKLLIVFLLLFILFNLFRALYLMVSNSQTNKPMSYYLGRRVGYSALVLLIILCGAIFGFLPLNEPPSIKPHTQTQTDTTKQHQQSANTKQQLERQNVA